MNVGELRDKLKDVPDFYSVLVEWEDDYTVTDPAGISTVEVEAKNAEVILQNVVTVGKL